MITGVRRGTTSHSRSTSWLNMRMQPALAKVTDGPGLVGAVDAVNAPRHVEAQPAGPETAAPAAILVDHQPLPRRRRGLLLPHRHREPGDGPLTLVQGQGLGVAVDERCEAVPGPEPGMGPVVPGLNREDRRCRGRRHRSPVRRRTGLQRAGSPGRPPTRTRPRRPAARPPPPPNAWEPAVPACVNPRNPAGLQSIYPVCAP